jgi:Na+-driven multidrug efflux pump
VFFLLIETKGATEKAISNTMRNVFGLAGIFVWAFAGTCNTMVANLIGQNLNNKVLPVIKKISLLSFIFSLAIIASLNIFPEHFFTLFNQLEDFDKVGIPVIRVVSLGIIFMSFANIWLNGVTGTGKTRVNLLIEIIAISLYLVYTWYFMQYHYLSLAMAWSNEFIYWLTIFLISYYYLNSGKWKSDKTD